MPAKGLQVKGTGLSSRIEYVRARGDLAFRRWLACLSPEARAIAEQPVLVNLWYDFEIFVECSVTIDEMFGQGDFELCRELGARTLDKYSGTIYRFAFRALDLEHLTRRAATAWRLHYSAGAVETDVDVDADGRKHLQVRLVGLESHHPAHCHAVRGWIRRAGELTNAKDGEESCVSCAHRGDGCCAWRFSYR